MINKLKTKYILEILAFAFVFFLMAGPALASEITSANVIRFVNESREAQGFSKLSEDGNLARAAQDKLDDMIKNNYFAHTSPSGTAPWHWFEKNKYDYRYAGENLAINFLTAEEQHKAWMNSPTHRKNILNANYQEIGVAVAAGEINGQTAIISVQEFGRKVGAADIVDGEKNFSGQGNKNLIEEGKEIVPSVLSVKSVPENGTNPSGNSVKSQDGFFKKIADGLAKSKSSAILILQLSAVWIYMLSLVLMPLAFLSVGIKNILILVEEKKLLKSN
ncbi:MAG: hypothetical protein QG620_655 [Patescibacteria group bacterium]|nr:hypothetical protein [Patescibacteria group bacterium]